MQIVIEIDEKRFQDIQRISEVQLKRRTPTLEQVVANGTPLPKGHGRLIDVDDKENLTVCFDDRGIIKKIEAPTIIEADKAESEEQT